MILDRVDVDVHAFETATGWAIKPEGACKGDVCVPLEGEFDVLSVADRPSDDCVVCSGGSYPALTNEPAQAVTLCGRDAVQIDPPDRPPIDLASLAEQLKGTVEGLALTTHLLRFEVDGCRFTVFPGGRALLFGVHDPLRARALYDRWLA